MQHITLTNPTDNNPIPGIYFAGKMTHGASKAYVFLHGLTGDKFEYIGCYKTLAENLSALGHSVLSFDMRCHGDSTADPASFTLTNLMSDALESVTWMQKTHPGLPIVLFGTSFGAITTILLAKVYSQFFERVCLLAPASNLDKLYLNPTNETRAAQFKGLTEQALIQGKPFQRTDRISFNRQLVTEFSLLSLPDLVAQTPLPFSLIHGTADSTIPYELSQELADHNNHVSLTLIENMGHGPIDKNDETGTSQKTKDNLQKITDLLAT